MTKFKLLSTGLAATAAALFTQGAIAQEGVPFDLQQDTNMVGLGVFAVPEYYGSSKYKAAAGPLIRYNFNEGMYVEWIGPEIRLNLVPRALVAPYGDVRAGFLIRARHKRDDDVDDEIVDRMQRIPTATEIGAFVDYHLPLDSNPLHKVVFHGDFGYNTTNVYDGATGNIRATYFHPFEGGVYGKPLLATVGFGLFFSSDHFTNRYFGINGTDVALFPDRGGVPYKAEGGLTSIKIPFTLVSQVDPKWLVFVGGQYERLLGDAKDSPIVQKRGDENQWVIGFGASYLF
jgi:outer membrane scaffolding protein for murein synthesis (MipA/OmpV family)